MGNGSSNSYDSTGQRIAKQESYVNNELSKIKSSASYKSSQYSDVQLRGAIRQDYNGQRSKYSNDYVLSSDYNKMRERR
jgi:hypothetical protein